MTENFKIHFSRDSHHDRRDASRGKVRRSLDASVGDGIFQSAMTAMVDSFLLPFAVALKASSAQAGQLASLPNLVGAVVQSQANGISDMAGGRRRAVRFLVGLQAGLLWILPFTLFLPASGRFTALLALAIGYVTCTNLISPIWGSLMSDLLPVSRRSGYLGWRSRLLGFVSMGLGLTAGGILHWFGRDSLAGFAVIFGLAGFFRWISWGFCRSYYEGGYHQRPARDRRTHFRGEATSPNFKRFILSCGLMALSVNLVGPLFPVFVLRDLHFSYLSYTLITVGAQASSLAMSARWGRQADHVGSLKILKATSFFFPILPLLWTVSRHPAWLLGVQMFSAFLWSGYNLCVTNFTYDAIPSSQRIRAIVLFNLFNGFCIFLGAWGGGQLLDILPAVHGYAFYTLGILSGILRFLCWAFVLLGVHEVRQVAKVSSGELYYSVLGFRMLLGLNRDVTRLGPQPAGAQR